MVLIPRKCVTRCRNSIGDCRRNAVRSHVTPIYKGMKPRRKLRIEKSQEGVIQQRGQEGREDLVKVLKIWSNTEKCLTKI